MSNDSIRKTDIPEKNLLRRLLKKIPFDKRYSGMSAAKIGRIGMRNDLQNSGNGSAIIDFMKGWFTIGNKTGCRFLVVDAYNTVKVTNFYEKNGFIFLTEQDKSAKTRIMYFDLITFRE